MWGTFCDLAKAFDYVNHEILLVQLQFYGIPYIAEDWFSAMYEMEYRKLK